MTRATLQGTVNSTGPSFKSRNNSDCLLRMNLGSRPSFKISSPVPQHPSPQTISKFKQPIPSRIDVYKPCGCKTVQSICVCGPPESCHEQSCLSRVFEMTNSMACHRETAASICVCEPPESCNEENSLSRAFEMSNPISSHEPASKSSSQLQNHTSSNVPISKSAENASLHVTNSVRN